MSRLIRLGLSVLVLVSLNISTVRARPSLTQHSGSFAKDRRVSFSQGQVSLTLEGITSFSYQEQDPSPNPTQSPTPTPDPEVEKANKETTLANAKKAAAEAKKAAADAEAAAIAASLAAARAKLGLGAETPSTATAPSGNTTTSDAPPQFIETQILAEAGGRFAVQALLEHLCGTKTAAEVPALKAQPMTTLIIYNANEKASVSQYRTTVAQLQLLHAHYKKLIDQSKAERDPTTPTAAAAPLLIPAATQLVKNVADLMNLFRTETQINSQTVTLDNKFVVSTLANQLLTTPTDQCKVTAIYHPLVYPLTVPKGAKSAIFDAYKQLLDDVIASDREVNDNAKRTAELTKEKNDLAARISTLESEIAEYKAKLEAEKKAPQKPKKQAPTKPAQETSNLAKAEKELDEKQKWLAIEVVTRIQRLEQATSALNTFKSSLTKLFEVLTAVDDATKQPIFNNLVNAERISDLLAEKGTYVLTLNVKASGTNRSRRNLFFNTKLDHSGGASIDANLFNNLDQLVFGKVENFYIEFTGSKRIRQRSGFKQLSPSGGK